MKVVYFAHSVLNRGGDKVVLGHLNHLASAGHEVVIKTAVMQTFFPVHPAINVTRLPAPSKGATILAALLEKTDADCILASIVPMAVLLAIRNGRKVLHFAQDDNEAACTSMIERLVVRCLYRLAFSIMQIRTVTVSTYLRDLFRQRFNAECAVVGNGIDLSVFYPDPAPRLLALKEGRKAILVLSRREYRKGFDIACESMAMALNMTSPGALELWTVGEEVGELGFGCLHRHFGYVREHELREILSSADLFLYPSRSEGFGLMVLEAFACKCPVVTSPAIPFARNLENALVGHDAASFGKLIIQMLTEQRLARRIVDKAYVVAEEFGGINTSAFEMVVAGRAIGIETHR